MGAAGFVTIYRESEVREKYQEMWSDEHSIEDDWWYPSWDTRRDNYGQVVRIELDGTWWLVDYSDDQGHHEGVEEGFWFRGGTGKELERLKAEYGDAYWRVRYCETAAQVRIIMALKECEGKTTEVWT